MNLFEAHAEMKKGKLVKTEAGVIGLHQPGSGSTLSESYFYTVSEGGHAAVAVLSPKVFDLEYSIVDAADEVNYQKPKQTWVNSEGTVYHWETPKSKPEKCESCTKKVLAAKAEFEANHSDFIQQEKGKDAEFAKFMDSIEGHGVEAGNA